MPIEGPLKELQIHDVFQLLDLGRKTGVLRVTSELRQNAGVVYFDAGGVVAAEIRSNPHPLGALLIRAGKVREDDVARAAGIQRTRPGHRLGDILVEMGALPKRELERQIRAQVEEVIFELMSWSEGYFSFEDGPLPAALGEATVRIPTESLLMEAARRIDEWSRIEAKVPHLGVVPRLTGSVDDDGALLDLLPFEWEVLAGIDGATDLARWPRALGRSDFDVARTLFGLATAGIIQLAEPVAPGQAEAPVHDLAVLVSASEEGLLLGEVARARFTAEEAVLAFPDEAAAHLVLGRVLIAEARYDEAVLRFSQALRCDPTCAPGPAAARPRGGGAGPLRLGPRGVGQVGVARLAARTASAGGTKWCERWRAAVDTLKDALGGRREQ